MAFIIILFSLSGLAMQRLCFTSKRQCGTLLCPWTRVQTFVYFCIPSAEKCRKVKPSCLRLSFCSVENLIFIQASQPETCSKSFITNCGPEVMIHLWINSIQNIMTEWNITLMGYPHCLKLLKEAETDSHLAMHREILKKRVAVFRHRMISPGTCHLPQYGGFRYEFIFLKVLK